MESLLNIFWFYASTSHGIALAELRPGVPLTQQIPATILQESDGQKQNSTRKPCKYTYTPLKKNFLSCIFPEKTAKTHFYSRTIAAVFVARRTCGSIYRGIFFPLLTAAGFTCLYVE